jgi:hypothetical protein
MYDLDIARLYVSIYLYTFECIYNIFTSTDIHSIQDDLVQTRRSYLCIINWIIHCSWRKIQ